MKKNSTGGHAVRFMGLAHIKIILINLKGPLALRGGTPSISSVLLMDEGVGGFPPNKYEPPPSWKKRTIDRYMWSPLDLEIHKTI